MVTSTENKAISESTGITRIRRWWRPTRPAPTLRINSAIHYTLPARASSQPLRGFIYCERFIISTQLNGGFLIINQDFGACICICTILFTTTTTPTHTLILGVWEGWWGFIDSLPKSKFWLSQFGFDFVGFRTWLWGNKDLESGLWLVIGLDFHILRGQKWN